MLPIFLVFLICLLLNLVIWRFASAEEPEHELR
jgi:hypothetical protein